ncbi:MAG: hypothetical protein IT168_04340 [Bryobacterales bacterium]|nr:hypothetical protein [Bryobacterales bacterium]
MVRREIEIDDSTNRLLTDLALEYDGDLNLALAGLLHTREAMEDFVDQTENAAGERLRSYRNRSESEFREGRVVSWDDLKRRNGL